MLNSLFFVINFYRTVYESFSKTMEGSFLLTAQKGKLSVIQTLDISRISRTFELQRNVRVTSLEVTLFTIVKHYGLKNPVVRYLVLICDVALCSSSNPTEFKLFSRRVNQLNLLTTNSCFQTNPHYGELDAKRTIITIR